MRHWSGRILTEVHFPQTNISVKPQVSFAFSSKHFFFVADFLLQTLWLLARCLFSSISKWCSHNITSSSYLPASWQTSSQTSVFTPAHRCLLVLALPSSDAWVTELWEGSTTSSDVSSFFISLLNLFSSSSLCWPFDRDVVRLQLLLRYKVRGTAHEVVTPEWLGEGNDIADARSPDHDGDQPVQT